MLLISSTTLPSRLGPLRQTYAQTDTYPNYTKAYTDVTQIVRETGLMRRTPWIYGLIGGLLLLGFGGCITGFILFGNSWYQLLIAGALGILFTQVAFLAHEAAHRQILSTKAGNDRLARALGAIVGMSYSWWDSKHTRHHANPNTVGKDPDIEIDTISFIVEDAASARGFRGLITRNQGWLFLPLLTLEGFNLHFLSIKHLLQRGPVKGRWTELSLIALRFAIVLTPIFLFLPLGMAFAFVGVMIGVFGFYMGASFAPNHIGMTLIAREARLDFFSKQVRTSRNISGGWWATWLMGGLNYQIEHHLFPGMSRINLARAREIVREQCQVLNVPYTETSLFRAHAHVISYLNRVGLTQRGDPFACPITAQYRRA